MNDDQYGYYRAVCDYCGDTDPVRYDTFNEAVKYNSLNHEKIDGEWVDLCDDCKEKRDREQRRL